MNIFQNHENQKIQLRKNSATNNQTFTENVIIQQPRTNITTENTGTKTLNDDVTNVQIDCLIHIQSLPDPSNSTTTTLNKPSDNVYEPLKTNEGDQINNTNWSEGLVTDLEPPQHNHGNSTPILRSPDFNNQNYKRLCRHRNKRRSNPSNPLSKTTVTTATVLSVISLAYAVCLKHSSVNVVVFIPPSIHIGEYIMSSPN